jgi:NADH dehydrogenase (ubiquinone) Fe-S protein 1
VSEVAGTPLPYDDVLSLRDRLWEISPTLVRYDITEPTSPEVASLGLKELIAKTATAKFTNTPYTKPISNFYQTDPISRASVVFFLRMNGLDTDSLTFVRSLTMAQCTRAFVKGEDYGLFDEKRASALA